ncbi:MAG: preprotein translocase subunit YajC [Methylococcaceae bacterium]|nr:preprotein translocase subunit YajC [Methylococcaceae bacterium]
MSFFISDAAAQAAPAASQPGIEGLLFPLAILVFFYFLFIRPQAKRSKEQKAMLKALAKGAEVVTSGGILGKVAEVDDNFVKLEINENLFIRVQRHAIANMMPKGTYKAVNKKSNSNLSSKSKSKS